MTYGVQIRPITGTSANRAGGLPATTAADVQPQLNSDIDLIVDGQPAPGGQPSTELQRIGEIRILRQGAITRDRLQKVLSAVSIQLSEEQPKQA